MEINKNHCFKHTKSGLIWKVIQINITAVALANLEAGGKITYRMMKPIVEPKEVKELTRNEFEKQITAGTYQPLTHQNNQVDAMRKTDIIPLESKTTIKKKAA